MSNRGNVGAALSAIARTVAESIELKDVFARVAEAVRPALPFDARGVNVVDCQVAYSLFDDASRIPARLRARFSRKAAAGDERAEAAA